jgi:autotransporter-associated beta strand protein
MRKKLNSGLALSLILMAAFLGCAERSSRGASFTWVDSTGGQATRWSNSRNWSAGGPPGATDSAIFSAGGSSTVQVQANATTTGISFNSSAKAFLFNGNGVLTVGSGGIVNSSANLQTFTGAIALGANQTWNSGAAGMAVNGIVSGTGSVTKEGTGTLTLAGGNTYTGGTTINQGTVQITSDSNLGAASGPVIFGGGQLQTAANGITSARNITLNSGGGTFDSGIYDATLSGTISGSGNFRKVGSGALRVTGVNTYSGATTVDGGSLIVGRSSSLGNTAAIQVNSATIKLDEPPVFSTPPPITLNSGTLHVNDHSATFGNLTVSGNSTIQLNSSVSPSASVTFASASVSGTPALTVTGWSDTADRDRIFVTGSASAGFLSSVNFTGFAPGARISANELLPVPEPAETALVMGILLLGAAAYSRHRSAKALENTAFLAPA